MALPGNSKGHLNVPVSSLYQRLEIIGKGKFGTVHKGIKLDTKEVVAIKILNLDTDEEEVKDVQMEVNFLSQLRSVPNITHYYGSYLNGSKLWIIMDHCAGGSVRTLLRPGPFEERYTSVILRESLLALSAVHQLGVIHRDLKAANILITKEGNVQICDFGVAAQLTTNALKRTTMAGTPYWMAPEVIIEGAMYNEKADIWSLGVTVYEMTTGNPPYSDKDALRAMQLIKNHEPPRLEGRQYSAILKEIIALCLDENPETRPTADELSKSKFIKTYKQLPTTILKELVSRYLIWRDNRNNNSNTSNGNHDHNNQSIEDNESESASIHNYDEIDTDVKWDFDSLNSAEYIIENDLDFDDSNNEEVNKETDDYAMNPAFMSHMNGPMVGSTIKESNTTFRANPSFMNTRSVTYTTNGNNNTTVGRTFGPSGLTGTHTNTNTNVGTAGKSSNKVTKSAPKSLLKLFEESNDEDEGYNEEEETVEDSSNYASGIHPTLNSSMATTVNLSDNRNPSNGILESEHVTERSEIPLIPIEIPEMDELSLPKAVTSSASVNTSTTGGTSSSSTVATSTSTPASSLTSATTNGSSITAARPRAPTITASLSNLTSHQQDDMSYSTAPQITRRTTISNTSARRTPSPKKHSESATSSPVRRISPPHMKPTSFSSQQQLLLQPINTKLPNISGPQTAPVKSHDDNGEHDPFTVRRQMSGLNSNDDDHLVNPQELVRNRSHLRLQMPKPISFPNPNGLNANGSYVNSQDESSMETNQFGVNVNSANVVAMTPVTEKQMGVNGGILGNVTSTPERTVPNNGTSETSPGSSLPPPISGSGTQTSFANVSGQGLNNSQHMTFPTQEGSITSNVGMYSNQQKTTLDTKRKLSLTQPINVQTFSQHDTDTSPSVIPEEELNNDYSVFEERLRELGIELSIPSSMLDPLAEKSEMLTEIHTLCDNMSNLLNVLGDEFEMAG